MTDPFYEEYVTAELREIMSSNQPRLEAALRADPLLLTRTYKWRGWGGDESKTSLLTMATVLIACGHCCEMEEQHIHWHLYAI